MPTQLQEFSLAGLNLDLSPWRSGEAWTSVNEMRFSKGYGEGIKGSTAVFGTANGGASLANPQYLLNHFDGTTSYWLYGCTNGIGVTDGATHKSITPGTFTTPLADDAWTGGVLNGVPFLNYGKDSACYWGLDFATPTVMAAMADAPECAALRPYKSVLVAMDCTNNTGGGTTGIPTEPTTLAWSIACDPGAVPSAAGDWTPGTSNIAGFFEVGADGGYLVDGIQFRDSFLIGKNNGFWVMDLVGGQEVMTLRRLFSTGGLLARNCMVEADGNVYAITDSDIIMTDGNKVISIAENQIRESLFEQIGDNSVRAWMAYNKPQREIWLGLPTGSNEYASAAYIYDLDNGKWGKTTPNKTISHAATGRNSVAVTTTWAGISGTWASIDRIWDQSSAGSVSDRLMWAHVDGPQIYQADDSETPDNSVLLLRESLEIGTATRRKTLRRVWPYLDNHEAAEFDIISVQVGAQDSLDDAISWQAPIIMTAGTDDYADVNISGRYFSVKFVSANRYALTGFGLEYTENGRF